MYTRVLSGSGGWEMCIRTRATPDGGRALNYAIRSPLGVIGVVCPWNLPLLLMTWKVGPALACGNAVVVKPSEETPATATLLGEVMSKVGIPPGVYNVVHGFGANSAGAFLTEHPVPGVKEELIRLAVVARDALGTDDVAKSEVDEVGLLRRQIARRCIYGLDINPMAVELARLALWIHTTGTLAKLFSEAVEAIDPRPVEGVRATGSSAIEEIVYGVIPQVMPLWISYSLYRFESNVRSASVVGMVGAGGIGVILHEMIRGFDYAEAAAVLLIIVVSVTLIDLLSARVRQWAI